MGIMGIEREERGRRDRDKRMEKTVDGWIWNLIV